KKILPHVIEPAVGIDRMLLMILADAYREIDGRTVLSIKPSLAPVQIAVFPLLSNKENLIEKARDVHTLLKNDFVVAWDDRGNIGKRYLYQDEVGTPFCITIDFDTLEDDTVTVRNRDSAKQVRVPIADLRDYLKKQ